MARRALAHLELGQIADLGGDRAGAERHYRMALGMDPTEELREPAEDYLEEPFRSDE